MPRRRAFLLAGGALAAPGVARAAWPLDRPIEIIVPAPAASAHDAIARLVAQHLPRQIPGARCVATNRPGAGGQIGFEALFHAPADGYTLGMVTATPLHAMAIERRPRYDPEGFTFLANIVDDPGGFWVKANSPWTSLADLQMAARGAPGEIGIGTTGIGSDDHLLVLGFESAAEITLLHVPYASTGPIQRDLLVGTLAVGAFNASEALPLLRGRRIRGLAQAGPERWPAAGTLPTFREGGFDVTGGAARGIAAPPGLPAEITLQFELALKDMLADPGFLQEAEAQMLPLRPLVGLPYRRRMAADHAALQALWQRRPWRD
ncbi:tripartite tricarboxylate transporter substrate binding protein [Roseococcus sp. SYP-B2431]|uniref:tripartite tricarboxylate transporter substrate binding protein n=1 Tax=Roseococcus sp. SYP-B2431 TaxID=2496640 RepID=UPI0013F3AE6D|nr:tripartite tricarboxylate transporter substrate binding protein [Roseococcus sp. SYP-B2431]